MANTWDRQKGEPPKPWAAFQIYRDMGPYDRALVKVPAQLGRAPTYVRVVEDWSSLYSWVDRCRDYDAHSDQTIQKRAQRELESMAERHAKTARMILDIVDLKLQAVLRRVGAQVNATGGADFDVPDLGLAVLPALTKVAADLERLSRGEVTSSAEVRIRETFMFPAALEPDELEVLLEKLRASGKLPGQDET